MLLNLPVTFLNFLSKFTYVSFLKLFSSFYQNIHAKLLQLKQTALEFNEQEKGSEHYKISLDVIIDMYTYDCRFKFVLISLDS